jgi:hypothetical protein
MPVIGNLMLATATALLAEIASGKNRSSTTLVHAVSTIKLALLVKYALPLCTISAFCM